MKYLLSVFMLALWMVPLFSQNEDDPVRVEFSARAEVFELIPCGEQGVLTFYQSIKNVDESLVAWVFIFYDKNLNPLWSKEIPVNKEFAYQDFYLQDEAIWLAFHKTGKVRRDEYNFSLLKLDILTGDWKNENLFLPPEASLVDFQIRDEIFAGGFNYEKDKALLLIRDLNTKTDTPVLFTGTPSYIQTLAFDKYSGDIKVALTLYASRKTSTLYVNGYNMRGQLQSSVQLTPPHPTQKLLNANLSFVSRSKTFVLGSYNTMNGNYAHAEESSMGKEAVGFYIASIEVDEQKFIRFHNLLNLKNITDIINNEELAELRQALEKEKKKGKKQSLQYPFLMHDLIQQGGNYTLLAEAYYPEYHQVSTMSYDFYGRPMPYYYSVFDGYRYFNAFVVNFDESGNLNWSNGIKIWDKRSMRLQQSVEAWHDTSSLVIFYNHEGSIISKVIEGYRQVGNIEKTRLSTIHGGDVQMASSNGQVRHWYDDYFLAYGYQTLRNNGLGGNSKRQVFYFNKLVFN